MLAMGRDIAGGDGSRLRRAGFTAVALILAGLLGACVQAKGPLLTGVKPLLGDQFQLNLFSEIVDGKAGSLMTSVFRWSANRYVRVSGGLYDVKYLTAEALDDADFLVEATDDKDYVYFLAHKVAEGAYSIRLLDENSLDAAARARTCVMADRNTCMVAARAQLDAVVRAAMGKAVPIGAAGLAVISAAEN